jgi:hypothetical protein
MGPALFDYNKRLTLLSVIQLSGEQCILIIVLFFSLHLGWTPTVHVAHRKIRSFSIVCNHLRKKERKKQTNKQTNKQRKKERKVERKRKEDKDRNIIVLFLSSTFWDTIE